MIKINRNGESYTTATELLRNLYVNARLLTVHVTNLIFNTDNKTECNGSNSVRFTGSAFYSMR
jgi:hypothetical protein